jgi:hypothetical protein
LTKQEETVPEEVDLFEALIDRIAEAVVDKIEQRRKIDLIAEAVLARLEEGLEREGAKGREGTKGNRAATVRKRTKSEGVTR